MQLQNSYIFLTNPYKNKETEKEKKINVISYIIEAFPNAVKTSTDNEYFKFEYTCDIYVGVNHLEIKFLINIVAGTYYVDVIVFGKNKLKVIKDLEYVTNIIEKSDISKNYIIISSYDAVSEYYCNKIYPKLNELERKLRKLLFNIYVVNFGRDYYQKTISKELQNKIKGVIQARGSDEKKEIERIQKFFYSLEFNDIKQLLFDPRWTQVDEKLKADFLKSHDDLSKLSDEELRKAFYETAPKSDWERFFANKINIKNIESLIEQIRKSRNNIAHCKFFYQPEYYNCNKAICKFKNAIDLAIKITEEKDFTEKNFETFKKSFESLIKISALLKDSISIHFSNTQFFEQYKDISLLIPKDILKIGEQIQSSLQSIIVPTSFTKLNQTLSNLSIGINQNESIHIDNKN